jgi:probable HAF family extracellular repeat protein
VTVAVGVTATAAVTAAQVIDLGTLPGGTHSTARAINNLGQIVGTSDDATLTGDMQVIWCGGTFTPLSAGNTNTFPELHQAINDSREIVSWINSGRNPTTGFLSSNGIYWNSSGVFSILPALPGGENGVLAYDINKSGLIVGESRDATGIDRHAVVWNRTTFLSDLGLMGAGNVLMGNETSARGVNDLGDIVGRALIGINYQAFLWRNGSFTDLGPGEAVDINNSGLIAGNTNPEVLIAWVWQDGVRADLPAIAGRPGNYVASGLNNNGDVVGWGPQVLAGTLGVSTAVLWRGGQVIELGNFPGGDRSRALGINDLGQIVGEGNVVPGGPVHALLWTVGTINTAPAVTLTATSSTSIRRGGKVTFKGTFTDPDSGPWTYTFEWGNGTTSGTAASPGTITATRTYSKSGRYQVSLKVTDAKGSAGTSGTIEVRVR